MLKQMVRITSSFFRGKTEPETEVVVTEYNESVVSCVTSVVLDFLLVTMDSVCVDLGTGVDVVTLLSGAVELSVGVADNSGVLWLETLDGIVV